MNTKDYSDKSPVMHKCPSNSLNPELKDTILPLPVLAPYIYNI